jgi:hypothetical protein
MIRFERLLRENTVYAATFVSLVALFACSDNENGAAEPTGTPSVREPAEPTSPADPADREGVEPADVQAMTPIGMSPSGEAAPVDVPLAPANPAGEGEGTITTPPSMEPPPAEPPVFSENGGVDCVVPTLPDFDALPTIARLPDPFTKVDGARISSKAEWRCRRQEIQKQAERYVYGEKPAKPETVSGTVANDSITVDVSNQGESTRFTVSVQLPDGGPGPYPALVSVGGFSQNDVVSSEGVAIIDFQPYAIGAEGTGRANKAGAFYDIYGSQSTTGLLVAWSWGVSRIIDVIEQSGGDILRADAMAVAGCSRFGKAAFAIGAFDQRIALTIPFESGSAGVPIWRGIPGEGAQSPGSAFGEQPWLGDAFGQFTNNVTRLPVDTHEVVAMVAPRGLLILDNPHIANLGPISAHVAALAGAEVYEALGVGDNISYHSAVQDGAHCSARTEHVEPLRQNLRKFLSKTENQPGAIRAAASDTGNLADWRDWETPTLD